ncbi:MAG: spore maturation protein [Deltaproteobacteria bacterium]|nr:MAG: spore maturation protein [Deltaproteobacteria bacterium]
MNGIFIALILGAVLTAAFSGTMPEVSQAGIESAKQAVQIAIGLLGMMALWLGFMRVLQDSGVMHSIARGLAPIMRRLFPDVPVEHPAMGAMIMNMAANILGLGNAATPFGLKAMQELDKLNPHKGVATNSMVLFLAINTSGVAVLPLGVVAIRASLGAENTAGIIVPTILATICSTVVGVLIAKSLQGRARFAPERHAAATEPKTSEASSSLADGIPKTESVAAQAQPASKAGLLALGIFFVVLMIGLTLQTGRDPATGWDQARSILSSWLLPTLMAFIVLFGLAHRVKVYESLVQGAKEGFSIFIMIIPFLVAILVAVGMIRASGALDWLIARLQPVTSLVGFPAEALQMALVRPLSGSGAMGVMTETMIQYGPDSFPGFLVSVMNGSTETTFYVLALYMGSIHVRATRHALAACLAADVTGVAAALVWSRLFY